MRHLVRGLVGGALATVAMSAFMLGASKLGALGEPPPRKLGRFAARLSGDLFPTEEKLNALATLGHFGVGIGAGGLFGALAPRVRRVLPMSLAGLAFGTLVWAAGYLGVMPALGLMRQPKHDRPGRPTTMILAHWIYGAVLAASVRPYVVQVRPYATRVVPSAA
jgi:hypothetical protein